MKTRPLYLCISFILFIVLLCSITVNAEESDLNDSATKWKGNANVAAEIKSGNTDRTSASVGAEGIKRTEQDRISLHTLFNYAKESKVETTHNLYGSGKYDYFLSEKLYTYLSIELLKDKYKDLKLRTVFGPGVGYQIYDDDIKTLSVEAGISYMSEDREVGIDDQWLTARLAANYKYTFNKTITFTDNFTIYPNLEETGEYTLRNEAALATALGANWSLRFANILDRDSNPSAGIEKSDWQWLLGLQYNFGA